MGLQKAPSILAAALPVWMACATAFAGDWPRWRGPDANGISREAGWQARWPVEGPKQHWKVGVGTGFSSVSVADGRVYTLGNTDDTDTVFCFDAATGRLLWKHSYPCQLDPKYYEGGPNATPTVDGGRVYSLSKRGDLFCLDAAKGTVVWSRNLPGELGVEVPTWGFAGSVLVEGGRLVLNVGSAGTVLEKESGKTVWTSGKEVSGYSTPVAFGPASARAAVLFLKDTVAAVRLSDGRELWSLPWKTSYDVNSADPILSGNQVFISSGYNRGGALIEVDGPEPRVVWENRNMRNHFNSSVLWKGHLYGVDENQLRCLDLDTGAVKWTERSVGKGSLMLADGKLIIQAEKGELIIAEAVPEAFRAVSRAQVLGGRCWTTPVLSNGRIYCRNARGDLVCLDVSGR